MSISALKSCLGSIKHLWSNLSYGKKCGEICNILEGSTSKFRRFKNVVQSIFISGVEPVAKTVVKDIAESRHVFRDTKEAYNLAKSLADASNIGKAEKALKIGAAVANNGVKPHLPGLMGIAFGFVPVPFIQPVGYAIGKVLQIVC